MNKAAYNAITFTECMTCGQPLSPQRIHAHKSHCMVCEPRQASCEQVELINAQGLRRAGVVRKP